MAPTLSDQQPFFITRQSANLMEDMEQQLSDSAAICVIYGMNGVGKTRLLKEFNHNRLPDVHKHTLSFNADGSCDDITQGSNGNQRAMLIGALQYLKHSSILVLDHFEYVQTDLSIRLFALWNKNAKNHNLGLIISTEPGTLPHLAEMSSQFDLSMKSVEMLPLSKQERLAFIGARVCQKTALYPKLSAALKRKVKQSRGLYPALETLLAQHGEEIRCEDRSRQPLMAGKWLFLPLLIIIAVVAFWLLVPADKSTQIIIQAQGVSPAVTSGPEVESIKPQDNYANPSALEAPATDLQPSVPGTSVTDETQFEVTNTTDTSVPNTQPMSVPASRPEAIVDQLSEDLPSEHLPTTAKADQTAGEEENVVKSQAVSASNARDNSNSAQLTQPVTVELGDIATPLELRLRATEMWLAENSPSTASLQLMLLSKNPNPAQTLNRYLEKLEQKGINLDNIFIYRKTQNNNPVFGVLYGQYINRRQASRQIKQLPAALGVDRPLPRTIRGIKDELGQN